MLRESPPFWLLTTLPGVHRFCREVVSNNCDTKAHNDLYTCTLEANVNFSQLTTSLSIPTPKRTGAKEVEPHAPNSGQKLYKQKYIR